jgi:hypothetical protein
LLNPLFTFPNVDGDVDVRQPQGATPMSRFVQPRSVNQVQGSGGDGYVDRVAKYIPAEIVAAFLAVQGLVISLAEVGMRLAVLSAVLVVFMILTPVYLRTAARASASPWKLQAVLGVIALPFWAYALAVLPGLITGPFDGTLYNGTVAAIALIVVSVAFGAFQPADSPPAS